MTRPDRQQSTATKKRQEDRDSRTLQKTNLTSLEDQFHQIVHHLDRNYREGIPLSPREIVSHELHCRIYLVDGSWLDVTEVYGPGGRPLKYQYNWYITSEYGVRWHNELHRTALTDTDPHHKHFVTKGNKSRTELFEHRSLWGVMEEIETALFYRELIEKESL